MQNNVKIEKLQPKDKRYSVSLGNGLTVRVMPSGKISWVVRIPFANYVKDITIGHYPEMNKRQAIHKTRQVRKRYELMPPKGYTFRDAFSLWCSLKRGGIVSYKGEKQRIEKYLLKPLGSYQIDEITAPMVIKLMQPLDKSEKRSTLKRCLMRVREIFNLAVCAGYISHNPMLGLSKLFKAPKVTPRASVDWRNLSLVLDKVASFPNQQKLIFLLSLTTLLRPGEVVKLKWSWINEGKLTIPAEEMKKRREYRVPLSTVSLNLLEQIKTTSKHKRSAFLFSGLKSNRHVCSQFLTNFLRSQHDFKDQLVPHGIRSIGRTWMADQEISYEVAEACLSHVAGDTVSRAYQRSDYYETRKEVMQRWSDYIVSCAPSSLNLSTNFDGH